MKLKPICNFAYSFIRKINDLKHINYASKKKQNFIKFSLKMHITNFANYANHLNHFSKNFPPYAAAYL